MDSCGRLEPQPRYSVSIGLPRDGERINFCSFQPYLQRQHLRLFRCLQITQPCLCWSSAGRRPYPHRPARLLIRGDARRFAVSKIVRPPKVPANIPFGPPTRPPSYASITAVAMDICGRPPSTTTPEDSATIDGAMLGWYNAARAEFTQIAGTDLDFKETKFRMAPAVPCLASPWVGDSAISALWRSLANRATQVAILLRKPALDSAQRNALLSHVRCAKKAILMVPKKLRELIKAPLSNWTRALANAVIAKST